MTSVTRVLTTGASGFIAKQLCSTLADQGFDVVASTRGDKDLKIPARIVTVGSLGPNSDWSTALRDVKAVIHLAARVHVMRESHKDPLAEFRKTNTEGSLCLAKQAIEAGVERFVFVSSIKANGEGRPAPYTEADPPTPVDPYGISKWEAETQLHKLCENSNMQLCIVRPPLVYGPGVGGNFHALMKYCASGLPLPLKSIDNRRSMISRRNLVSALIRCLTHPAAAGQTFLVRDGQDVSTPQLIRYISRSMNKSAKLFSVPFPLLQFAGKLTGRSNMVARLGESLCVNDNKIRTLLDWKPPQTIEQGIDEAVRFELDAQSEAAYAPW